jgi:hypothetical protein
LAMASPTPALAPVIGTSSAIRWRWASLGRPVAGPVGPVGGASGVRGGPFGTTAQAASKAAKAIAKQALIRAPEYADPCFITPASAIVRIL